ncbi:MAG: tryptophan 7-halogenase [Gammaproteobacteria bacterium]|nr:tryptophan 7-halogenase [Gammaproteobacteria bacterium]NNJ72944.1 tryptophan 7-halogenase [Enterobacterales bacterium]
MNSPINQIVIVGGGTAGWLTAAVLGAHFNLDDKFKITLIESPNVKTIGVGEGTWPSMAATLRRIGIPEAQFIAECDASFKQGSRFYGWRTGDDENYYHPFSLPLGYSDINLPDHWLAEDNAQDFGPFATAQTAVCDHNLAPKQENTPDYASVMNYGYHLDAGKFADLLKSHCLKKLGIKHISDDVIQVLLSGKDNIEALATENHGKISGDLFIDCTGFNALLIGRQMAVPFISRRDILFNDRAIAVQVPHPVLDAPIASVTNATAHANGWIWDIALPTRRGVGLVYSSSYADEESSLNTLEDYLKKSAPHINFADLEPRSIPINPGHREKFWVGNCVAIGLSSGFIDPLEATAMVLIEMSARFLTENLPADKAQLPQLETKFNERFTAHWSSIMDFIKLHYVLSQRDDSDYWRDHRKLETMPVSLAKALELWQSRPPWHADVTMAEEMFPPASYQYILYGMGFKSESGLAKRRNANAESKYLSEMQQRMTQEQQKFITHLPSNRHLLHNIKQNWLANKA